MSSASNLVFGRGELVARRYEITRFISQGGMGQVYEAADTELSITVALKTLNPEIVSSELFLKRFKQEIEIARQITHRNVCRTFDLGRHTSARFGEIVFLTMEFLRGPTLATHIAANGRLPAHESLILIRQMCEGLAAAHQLGIVHRDFKSSNVMLIRTADAGMSVKITDFGLAQRVYQTPLAVTALGVAVGTPAYMAPEQMLGRATAASDVYSLGVVIYEMLSGSLPFGNPAEDSTEPRSMLAPELIGVKKRWNVVVGRCLDQNPSRRYPSALDVIDALESSQSGPRIAASFGLSRRNAIALAGGALVSAAAVGVYVHDKTSSQKRLEAVGSLAVLPITNNLKKSDTDYLADGMTESLISSLSQLQDLRLMSRSAVMRLKSHVQDPIDAGKKLHVDAVLTGSMRQAGNRIIVALELVEVPSGVRLWGDDLSASDSQLPQLSLEVADEIGRTLRRGVEGVQRIRLSKQATAIPGSYHNYLRGRYEWNKRTSEGYQKAVLYFKQAIEDDPTFALAYAGLADAYSFQSGFRKPDEVFPLARAAAKQALTIDDQIAEAHASLGFVLLQFDWDWTAAEKEYRRAIQLNYNYATAHAMYARLLSVLGRFPNAFEEINIAKDLDPLSIGIALSVGFLYYLARRFDRAIEQFKRALDLEPSYSDAESYLAYALAAEGQFADAISRYEKLLRGHPDDSGVIADLGRSYALAGRPNEAKKMLQKLKELNEHGFVLPTLFAELYAALGERDDAFRWLDRSAKEKTWQMIYLKVEPIWDPLRTDNRFKMLLSNLNLLA